MQPTADMAIPQSENTLTVRPLRREDVDWYAASLDPEIVRWSREEPIADVQSWWESERGRRIAIECCGDLVGAAKVAIDNTRAEISYWVSADKRGRGYASAALVLLTAQAKGEATSLPIELEIHPLNEASIRVAVKAGYEFSELRESCDTCADTNGQVAIYRYAG